MTSPTVVPIALRYSRINTGFSANSVAHHERRRDVSRVSKSLSVKRPISAPCAFTTGNALYRLRVSRRMARPAAPPVHSDGVGDGKYGTIRHPDFGAEHARERVWDRAKALESLSWPVSSIRGRLRRAI
jgi:hypothetical protein